MLETDIKFVKYKISKLEEKKTTKKHTELGTKRIQNNIDIYKDILRRLEDEK